MPRATDEASDPADGGFRRVVLVAGPSGSGKPTLMRDMRSGAARTQLPAGFAGSRRWTYTTSRAMAELGPGGLPDRVLVVHVDISQLVLAGPAKRARLARLSAVLESTRRIDVLTLRVPYQVLVARLSDRRGRLATASSKEGASLDRLQVTEARMSFLGDEQRLHALYEAWADYLRRFPVRASWSVDTSTWTRCFVASGPGETG